MRGRCLIGFMIRCVVGVEGKCDVRAGHERYRCVTFYIGLVGLNGVG